MLSFCEPLSSQNLIRKSTNCGLICAQIIKKIQYNDLASRMIHEKSLYYVFSLFGKLERMKFIVLRVFEIKYSQILKFCLHEVFAYQI